MRDEAAGHFRGYPVSVHQVTVAGRVFKVIGPSNHDSLVDEPRVTARFAQDEYLPYWAELWPAGLLLADAVAAWGPAEAWSEPPGVLELGCGLGLVSLVALSLGYAVTASDYDEDALAFATESARLNGLPPLNRRHLDWRETYRGERFARIIAADVLYETRYLRPVAEFLAAQLEPDGFALLSDPNRGTADDFAMVARHCGLTVEVRAVERRGSARKADVRGRVFRARRKPVDGAG